MYIKDFDKWNSEKKNIDNKIRVINFHEREIWWSSFGLNIGSEQNGSGDNFERPVIILKKLSGSTFVCVPLSTKKRLEKFQSKVNHETISGYALLDQVRVIDSKRLLRKIGFVDKKEFIDVKSKIKSML